MKTVYASVAVLLQNKADLNVKKTYTFSNNSLNEVCDEIIKDINILNYNYILDWDLSFDRNPSYMMDNNNYSDFYTTEGNRIKDTIIKCLEKTNVKISLRDFGI